MCPSKVRTVAVAVGVVGQNLSAVAEYHSMMTDAVTVAGQTAFLQWLIIIV